MWRESAGTGPGWTYLTHSGGSNPVGIKPLNNYICQRPDLTDYTLDATESGKTALVQGPVANTAVSRMQPVWEQPEPLTFSKKHGFLHSMRLDFNYDPTAYDTNYLHNACIFIVKIVNFARASTTALGSPALRPGTVGWDYQESFLDQSGDIHGEHLIRDVHYTSGVLDDGSVTLSPKYFNVLHK